MQAYIATSTFRNRCISEWFMTENPTNSEIKQHFPVPTDRCTNLRKFFGRPSGQGRKVMPITSDVLQLLTKYRGYKNSLKPIRIILSHSDIVADASPFPLPSIVGEVKGVFCNLCLACFLSCPTTISPQVLITIPNQT